MTVAPAYVWLVRLARNDVPLGTWVAGTPTEALRLVARIRWGTDVVAVLDEHRDLDGRVARVRAAVWPAGRPATEVVACLVREVTQPGVGPEPGERERAVWWRATWWGLWARCNSHPLRPARAGRAFAHYSAAKLRVERLGLY